MAGMEFRIKAVDEASNVLQNVKNNLASLGNINQQIAGASNSQPIVQSSTNQSVDNLDAQSGVGDTNSIAGQNFAERLSLISENLTKITEMLPQILEQARNKNVPSAEDNIEKQKKELSAKQWVGAGVGVATAGISAFYNNEASKTRRQAMSLEGDVWGIEKEKINGGMQMAQSATSVIPLIGALFGPAGALIGASAKSLIDVAIQSYGKNKLAQTELDEKSSNLYKDRLSPLEKAVYMYEPGALTGDRETSHASMLAFDQVFNKYSKGTNLDIDEFANLAMGLSQYGVNNADTASSIVRNAGLTSRYTNTDINSLINFMGTRARFGSSNTEADLNFAFSASQASGLQKEQFGEFLDGLQDVIESGIQNGFVASSDEVSKNMVMFSKLSDNDKTWEGKYGFKNLQSINSGLSSATSLSSSTQLATFQALRGLEASGAKGGAYINGQDMLNTFSLMEKGLTPDNFSAISKTFNNIYGNDVLSNVASWKELSGLNWTGSMKLYEMQQKALKNGTDFDFSKEIADLKANPEYQTDATAQKDLMNDIKTNTTYINSAGFKKEMELLEVLAGEKKNGNDIDKKSAQGDYVTSDDPNSWYANHLTPADGVDPFDYDYLNTKGLVSNAMYGNYERFDTEEELSKYGDLQATLYKEWQASSKDGIITETEKNQLIKNINAIAGAVKDGFVLVQKS